MKTTFKFNLKSLFSLLLFSSLFLSSVKAQEINLFNPVPLSSLNLTVGQQDFYEKNHKSP